MRNKFEVILLASLFIAGTQLAAARAPGGAGGSGSPHFGGPSPMSQAPANMNGRFATDRETGTDRAADRMSSQGATHENATDLEKKKGKAQRSSNAATRATPATPAVPGTRSAATRAVPATPASPADR